MLDASNFVSILHNGFVWGNVSVTRVGTDSKDGRKTLRLDTPKHAITIHVTRTGKVRIFEKCGGKK